MTIPIHELLHAARHYATPHDLYSQLAPGTISTSMTRLLDAELIHAATTPNSRLILSTPPQEGKSTLTSRALPLWMLRRHPERRIVLGSYAADLATGHARWVRDQIRDHPELGVRLKYGEGRADRWTIEGGGGLLAVGVGGGITGKRADLLIIDDPHKDRAEADSQAMRDHVWDWWTDSLVTRLAQGASVIVIMTRWHEDDLAGRLTTHDPNMWRTVTIPAQADSENDPLGRAPGEWLESVQGRQPADWERIRRTVGSRTWQALYQGAPTAAEGGLVKRDWWREYDLPMWVEDSDGARCTTGRSDTVIISGDLAFKDTRNSDYVVLQVWARRAGNAYLLDQIRGRFDFPETQRQLRALSARWPQAALKLIEDKANGPAIIAAMSNELPGIVPVEPVGSKQARLSAVAPYIEAGNVLIPSPRLAPWVGDFLEEFAAFPNGKHDDQVDATSQALHRLFVDPITTGHDFWQPDEFDHLDETGWIAAPY